MATVANSSGQIREIGISRRLVTVGLGGGEANATLGRAWPPGLHAQSGGPEGHVSMNAVLTEKSKMLNN